MRKFLATLAEHGRLLGKTAVAEAISTLVREFPALERAANAAGFDLSRRQIPPGDVPSVYEVEELMAMWAGHDAAGPMAPFLATLRPTPLARGNAHGFVVCYLTVAGGGVFEGQTPIAQMRGVVAAWHPITPDGPHTFRCAPRLPGDHPLLDDEDDAEKSA